MQNNGRLSIYKNIYNQETLLYSNEINGIENNKIIGKVSFKSDEGTIGFTFGMNGIVLYVDKKTPIIWSYEEEFNYIFKKFSRNNSIWLTDTTISIENKKEVIFNYNKEISNELSLLIKFENENGVFSLFIKNTGIIIICDHFFNFCLDYLNNKNYITYIFKSVKSYNRYENYEIYRKNFVFTDLVIAFDAFDAMLPTSNMIKKSKHYNDNEIKKIIKDGQLFFINDVEDLFYILRTNFLLYKENWIVHDLKSHNTDKYINILVIKDNVGELTEVNVKIIQE